MIAKVFFSFLILTNSQKMSIIRDRDKKVGEEMMNLKFMDEVLTIENNFEALNEALTKCNERLEDSDYVFSHFLIDGTEMYDDVEGYLQEHLNSVNEIELILRTKAEMINDIMLSAESYLTNAIPEIHQLVDEFYSNPTEESWGKFGQLIEGMQWLVQMVATIDSLEHKISNWNDYLTNVATLEQELQTLLDAMENADYVLIADIIQYELIPSLTNLQAMLTTSIDTDGKREQLS